MEFGIRGLAITGGIAEGKSTVLGYVRDAGVDVVSADEVARQIWDDPDTHAALSEALEMTPPLSRDTVRELISTDASARRVVNGIMHPRILKAMIDHPAQVVEVPLLVEGCLFPLFRRVWVVTCGLELQLERLSDRTGDRESAKRLVAAQMPTEAKTAFADRIVRTNQPEPSVRAYVLEALSQDFG